MGEDWYGDNVECLVNTKNVSDSSPPQEMEYHVTVSHIFGSREQRSLCTLRWRKDSRAMYWVTDALQSWAWTQVIEVYEVFQLGDLRVLLELSVPWLNIIQ